jgi:hypothetical protein
MLLKNDDKVRRKVTKSDLAAVGVGLILGGVLLVLLIHAVWGPFYLWMFR